MKKSEIMWAGIGILVICAICVFWVMGHHPLAWRVGEDCRVQFDRRALGSMDTLVSPFTNVYGGTEVSMYGKIRSVRDDGIMFETEERDKTEGRELWVPMESILLISFKK